MLCQQGKNYAGNTMSVGFTEFRGNIHNSFDVLQWIKQNIPCFTGMVPREWTQAATPKAARAA